MGTMERINRTKERFDPAPLRLARKRRGLTLQKLAMITGIPVSTICHTLAGKRAAVVTVKNLADALAVDPAACWPDESQTPAAVRAELQPEESTA